MSITVNNLTKNYGATKALKDISFQVNTGEILGFLGPNGAGKTTTMKIITCFLPPTSGTVEVDDFNIKENSIEVRRKIGYLPEMNPLYPDMNVIESLQFSAQLQGVQKDKLNSRTKEMIDVCGLGGVRHKDIDELSKGYRQRVGLAQALIHDPDVLILDEPTSGLDPNQIVEIRNLIKRIGLAKTVILSTHILSEVQATCGRVIIVNQGTIVADGTLAELQERFQGQELIELELKASGDPIADISPKFKELNSELKIEVINSENGVHSLKFYLPKGTDLREQMFKLAVNQNWEILGMKRDVTSLEELFHNLTTTIN